MSNPLSRREMLKRSAVVTGAAVASHWLQPLASAADQASGGAPKKVLFFTKSAGFQHSVITRPANDPSQLAYAEKILTDLGAKNGFDVVCSKDGTIFSPENIKQFDLFVFCTTGDLTVDSDKFATKKNDKGKDVPDPEGRLLHKEPGMPAGAKEAFLEAIRAGKGFIGFHCAADTFHSAKHVKGEVNLLRDVDEQGKDEFDPYIKMLGGEFIVHGKQQNATLKTIDPAFPGAAAFDDAKFTEEWYSLKNFSPDLHVILAQDCTGMSGAMYERAAFPETWIRRHGEGRVFYTSMGHREDVWQKPEFIALVISALNWTSRRIDADITPNIAQATPGANVRR